MLALVSLALIAATSVWCADALAQATSAGPKIEINIPTIKFTDIQVEEAGSVKIIDVPWIAQYISGMYKYMVAVAAVVAALILVIGGFLWLTSAGDAGRVEAAKKRISDAVLGLALLLGTYLILNVVNPNLTKLDALKITTVKRDPFSLEFNLLVTTTDTSAGGAGGGAGESSSGPIAGSHTPTYSSCPISLSAAADTKKNPSKDPRNLEFFSKIGSVVKGTTTTEKVISIADAAAKCGVHFGSCGRTANTIRALASGTGSACLQDSGGCTSYGPKQPYTISAAQRKNLASFRCRKNPSKHFPNGANCVQSGSEATKKVYQWLKGELGATWPDSWADKLQPGDTIIVYNGNTSDLGTHAAIFLGWGSGGRAQVIQGSFGAVAKAGPICIKSSCSSPTPLVKVFRSP